VVKLSRFAALYLLSLSAMVRAQSINAGLTGRVSDPSHAVIAGAKIAAISAGTNLHYETLTNASGEYHLSNLPPNDYRIEVEKPGFKRSVRPDVTLHVQDALVIDFEMALGAASETINVEAGALLVNTESATVSTVVDRALVENLPLNGRSFQTLIMLTPGVVMTATAFDDQGQFSVNGQRADANYFTVDGVSANFGVTGYGPLVQAGGGALPALSAAGGTNSLVSVDAMQEFRIQTSSFAPEYGRTPGAQISIVTRSGTNAVHGTLSEYFRNDKLDAKDWFVNFNGLPKPAERVNDFGGVLGGPVRRDRTFFFFSYEGLRLRQPLSQQTVVPDAASRQQAPAAVRPFLNAFPVANGPALGPGLAQFSAGYSNPSMLNAYSIRLDHTINSKLNLFGRYNYSPSNLKQRGPAYSAGTVLNMVQTLSSSLQTGTTGFTAMLTPGIANEVRANYSNQRVGTRSALDSFGGGVPLDDSVLFPAGNTSANGVFSLYIPGAGQYNQGVSFTNEQRQVNVIDSLSVTRSRHQLKFGVDYRWLAPFSIPYSYRQYVQFTGMSAAPGGVLSGTAQIAGTYNGQGDALLSHNFSAYAQDTWKINSRLTLTYGARWDVNPPLKGKNAANDPFTATSLDPATIALAPRGTPLYETRYGNVAPRVGLAYQLGPRSSWGATLRAGFGIFYDLGSGPLGGVSTYFPYLTSKVINLPAFPLSPQDAAAPPPSLAPPVNTILVADPHLKLPRSYQWNVALEQPLGASQSLSATYIGAIGRDLVRVTQRINLSPNFPFVGAADNLSTSDYHALQLKFQRRMTRGLQGVASYSLSHSIDTASTDAFANYLNTPGSVASPSIDRGNSDFDIRHAFTAGLTYDLPSIRSSPLVHAISAGWSVDAFGLARTAPPVDVIGALVRFGTITLYPRPNVAPGAPLELFASGYPGGKVFNKAAFTAAVTGQQGNFGRNVLRGFNATQADIGVQRLFRAGERYGIRFRAEFFNILNHPNFGNPTNSLPSPLFGNATQTLANFLGSGGANGGFNPLYQIGGPRSIQLAAKLQF